MGDVTIKRVYESVAADDGKRILVDRLWPRGISKKDDRIHTWFKEVAPSDPLRKWFHAKGDFASFTSQYRMELENREEARQALNELCELSKQSERITLVYASKDVTQNNATVLKKVIEEIIADKG